MAQSSPTPRGSSSALKNGLMKSRISVFSPTSETVSLCSIIVCLVQFPDCRSDDFLQPRFTHVTKWSKKNWRPGFPFRIQFRPTPFGILREVIKRINGKNHYLRAFGKIIFRIYLANLGGDIAIGFFYCAVMYVLEATTRTASASLISFRLFSHAVLPNPSNESNKTRYR